MKKIAILGFFLIGAFAQADVGNYAHFGISNSLTTAGYGACKKIFHLGPDDPKWGCKLAAALFSTSIGALKEGMDRKGSLGDMGMNALGTGSALIVIEIGEF